MKGRPNLVHFAVKMAHFLLQRAHIFFEVLTQSPAYAIGSDFRLIHIRHVTFYAIW